MPMQKMPETQVQSLGWEDPLELQMAIHSSILPGEAHGQRSLVGYSLWGSKESDTTELAPTTKICLQPSYQLSIHKIGGLKGLLPLQAKP